MSIPNEIVCPFCETIVPYNLSTRSFPCLDCERDYHHNGKWLEHEDILDIMYENPITSVLSNLFPHKFCVSLNGLYNCNSIEGFLRSLTIKDDKYAIRELCNYWGFPAYKVRAVLPDWRVKQMLYYQGKEIPRESQMYENVITVAYNALFSQSSVFRLALGSVQDKKLVHSIGCHDKTQTLLTPEEYIYQLDRLREML